MHEPIYQYGMALNIGRIITLPEAFRSTFTTDHRAVVVSENTDDWEVVSYDGKRQITLPKREQVVSIPPRRINQIRDDIINRRHHWDVPVTPAVIPKPAIEEVVASRPRRINLTD